MKTPSLPWRSDAVVGASFCSTIHPLLRALRRLHVLQSIHFFARRDGVFLYCNSSVSSQAATMFLWGRLATKCRLLCTVKSHLGDGRTKGRFFSGHFRCR